MTKLIVGALITLGVLVSAFGYGIRVERALCNERVVAAVKKFTDLQDKVTAVVEEFEASVDLEKGDRDDAEKLKEIVVRLKAKAAISACVIDGADVADAGRLRDGPARSTR